ncbi:hypothetical protein BUE80_DR010722 [Diplocarpon rosae]|nr:hypothetical protein BUE80_DR010722 [Diplocarpon rosae]
MSGHRHSSSRCKSRSSRSRGFGLSLDGYHGGSGRADRDPFGGRRGMGSKGGERIGWGRNGAVRLDDPPILSPGQGVGRDGVREGQSSDMASPRLGGGSGVGSGRTDMSGGPDRMDPCDGLRGMDPTAQVRMGMGMGMGMGSSEPPASLMMGRTPLDNPRAVTRQPSAHDSILELGPHARHESLGMEHFGSPLMAARPSLTGDHGPRFPGSTGSWGNFDTRAARHPRLSYGPQQHIPMQHRFANYRYPYVEDYEVGEMEVGLAHQAAMQQMMRSGGNPFFDEGQYGDLYGGMGGVSRMAPAGGEGHMGHMRVNGGMGPVASMGGGMEVGMQGMSGGPYQYW